MNRIPVSVDLSAYPAAFHPILQDAAVFDSSCSREARVWFIDKDGGYYLKRAPKDTLDAEARMTRYFHEKGLAAEVLSYLSADHDWLLTRRVPGEDCIHPEYLEDPKRLSELTGLLLRQLHALDPTGCPVLRTQDYLQTAAKNYHTGHYDNDLFPDNWGYRSAGEAWSVVREFSGSLKSDTLLHGDYCLPNIILNDWAFSGFIDLDHAGIGDRHIDLFWGVWTLQFNLKTDIYADRFLDAYGWDRIDPEILRAIAAFEVFG